MLTVWTCLLGTVVAMWLYLRVIFVKLLREWREHLAVKEAEWNRDLWAVSQKAERDNKLRVLLMARDAHEEVAKPLDPYVFVFVLFAIPAVVMTTDYCVDHSSAKNVDARMSAVSRNSTNLFGNHAIHHGLCDVTCEMILAFRSLATVVAYFCWREHRAEAFDLRTLATRMRSRLASCLGFSAERGRVKFASYEHINQVFVIPRNGS
jgi:hypothetical protein